MNILGIESSCDDTGLAIINSNGIIVDHITSSQHEIHAKYGGIVPELASRDHVKKFIPLLEILLHKNKMNMNEIDIIAFTNGPGLLGPLLAGASLSKTLGWSNNIPTIEVNHLEAHIYSPMITEKNLKPPFVSLLVSGGHTILSSVDENFQIKTLGTTLDDSAGECFDKIARKLNLGYPGGPEIAKRSELSNKNNFMFPRPMIRSNDYNFSFSGLKTHALNTIQAIELTNENINNISYELQSAIVDTLISKSIKASKDLGIKDIVITGGVSANKKLREDFSLIKECRAYFPDVKFSTDNGAMIAYAGFLKSKSSTSKKKNYTIKPNPSLSL
ncbi:tRNA (adenosine(37)-N6)-threonylcarbamoyltransferase complex transferase subunit TsaD [Gammaproteobacteria bacterium]|nr:tRNA (adenosine(37)-N6)-threonylcarbamoyltransferase complex transferase subunit TsaD [Gammaproteobacteria bacterium]